MNNTDFFRNLEERPLRMAVEPQLPRPHIVARRATAPVRASDSPLPAIVIIGLALWLVYVFMRTVA
jgi:hypothetical protein